MWTARNDIFNAGLRQRLNQLVRQLQIQIFVPCSSCRLATARFARQNSPGNAGRFKNLLHRQRDRLAVRIEIQSASEPEQPFLRAIENRKGFAVDEFFTRVLSYSPWIVR